MPRVFGDNMVLHRDLPLPVWGKAAPGEVVTVGFAGQQKSATADAGGQWRVTLDPLPADKTPQILNVRGENEVVFTNVLVGEVWLCSGQSNMEGLNPESSFLPELKKLLPDDPIHHVKFAQGGQPIRKWVKNFDEIAKKNKLPAMNDPGKSSTTCTTPRKAMTCSVSAWRGRRCG